MATIMPITNPYYRCDVCKEMQAPHEMRGPVTGKKICLDCCYKFYQKWRLTVKKLNRKSHAKKKG